MGGFYHPHLKLIAFFSKNSYYFKKLESYQGVMSKKYHTGFHIQAVKFPLCTNCLAASSHQTDSTCRSCRQKTVHLFDSQSEASRYIFLKNDPHVTDLRIQIVFNLYSPQIKHRPSWGGKRPDITPQKHPKLIVSGKYTADFVYHDDRNIKGYVIEDFKPYDRQKKKPIIKGDTQLRLNQVHTQHHLDFDIVVSYLVPKVGYQTKTIKPTKKQ